MDKPASGDPHEGLFLSSRAAALGVVTTADQTGSGQVTRAGFSVPRQGWSEDSL